MTTAPVTPAATLTCPACGNENLPDAVFCAECDKALGEFAYVGEAVHQSIRWHEALAERATAFVAKPQFLVVHALWFALWVALNTGFVLMVRRWDGYPFSLLGLLLSMEAILLSGFVLISQNRQNVFSAKDARLDYEVNVRTYRELRETRAAVEESLRRLATLEARLSTVSSPAREETHEQI